jgi:RNA polymerase sigma-70 factor (ECF subfamily)
MRPGDGEVNRKERLAEATEALAPRLLAYFARRVIPREDAADLLVETLTIAWKKNRTLPSDPDLHRAWLFATAARVLANHRRGSGRRDRLTERLRDHLHVESDKFAQTDLQLDVQAAIEHLPAESAELIRLVYWEGLSGTEAGSVLGIPESTARLRIKSAREKLAISLDQVHT